MTRFGHAEERKFLGEMLRRLGEDDSDDFEIALEKLMSRFFSPNLSRKALFNRLRDVPEIDYKGNLHLVKALQKQGGIIVITESPLRAILTPYGLLHLYSIMFPGRRSEFQEQLLKRFERQYEDRIRLTLRAFSGADLTIKEMGSLLFLLYNDSTSPARGKYIRTPELWAAIDRIVQAFVQNNPEAGTSPHFDGAPGRWYLGEANRKLGMAIRIGAGQYYVKPQELGKVENALQQSIFNSPDKSLKTRFRAFQVAFERERKILALKGVLFANSESIQRCQRFFQGGELPAKNTEEN